MRTLADVFVGKSNNLTFIRLMAALSVIYGHTTAIVPGATPDWGREKSVDSQKTPT